ncbi:unnamed protein product [Phyllotreta striolata]|uniref:RRM domain-containing protein n=1 Tax=Phyllotreta striolata TaxID=444603 RepID=A0A9N9XS00_PHYSR|nr:unnamed protein product [Phyllotreta striolata]
MDVDLLRDGEHFSTFEFMDEYSDELSHLDSDSGHEFNKKECDWNLDTEREINGDIALIPVCDLNLSNFNDPLSNIEDFHKIVSDLQQFINIDPSTELGVIDPVQTDSHKIEPLDPNIANFDITKYINEDDLSPSEPPAKKVKAGVKKIDLNAQRYLIDDDEDVDVETIDCDISPVLEAKDVTSLLEQFEATELPELPSNFIEDGYGKAPVKFDIKQELLDEPIDVNSEPEAADEIEKIHLAKDEVADDYTYSKGKRKNVVKEHKKIDENVVEAKISKIPTPQPPAAVAPTAASKPNQPPLTPNKQILDSLPKELIERIRESSKRKSISVIPPIPARKRGAPPAGPPSKKPKPLEAPPPVGIETVRLDHDYCCASSTVGLKHYPKVPMKDSGFESADEDDRTLIAKQPMVKNVDGKLMVSLLKVNTIHTSKANEKKKKLNLEEYKRRREGVLKSHNNSLTSSPLSSACSSPSPEDETTKMLRHREKLLKMAKEVLKATPKSDRKADEGTPAALAPLPLQSVPADMEMKTLVSTGVNTDFKICGSSLDPLAPVERLDEIKPLLQKASDKINENSLITSVIQNIPKVIDICDKKLAESGAQSAAKVTGEHGEDKTIVYLAKNRAPKETRSVECQTNISLIQQSNACRTYRRQRRLSSDSTSSESSRESRRSRGNRSRDTSKDSSRCSSRNSKSSKSSSSSSSSSYSSRSSSRSPSPRYARKDKERFKEVEERRVIYIGRIPPRTKKEDLKKRFQKFGPITNVSLHSRDHNYLDNYGFVTFANKLDAYEAIEHGNDDPWLPKFDLSFGGRRIFCQTSYCDLDNMRDECGYFVPRSDDSFDQLLKEMQDKLRKRRA